MSPSDRIEMPLRRANHITAATQPRKPPWNDMPPFHSWKISAGCWMKNGRIVEQHIAGAAAEDDADRDPEDEIVDLRQRDRRRPAPQLFALDQRAGIDPAQHDAADIGQRIPADRDRPERDGDRDRIPERRWRGRASCPCGYTRLRRYSASSRSQCRSAASRW